MEEKQYTGNLLQHHMDSKAMIVHMHIYIRKL